MNVHVIKNENGTNYKLSTIAQENPSVELESIHKKSEHMSKPTNCFSMAMESLINLISLYHDQGDYCDSSKYLSYFNRTMADEPSSTHNFLFDIELTTERFLSIIISVFCAWIIQFTISIRNKTHYFRKTGPPLVPSLVPYFGAAISFARDPLGFVCLWSKHFCQR